VFERVQAAVTARDLSAVRGSLGPEMLAALQQQIDGLRGARRVNRVEGVNVQRASVSEAWQESGRDWVTVALSGSLIDYTVDETNGVLVEGSRVPQPFEEYWTFTRPVGPGAWTLSAIQTG
jgi:predicted lipid-binding transport protein (Tim44 family)